MNKRVALLLTAGLLVMLAAGCGSTTTGSASGKPEPTTGEFPQMTWKFACSATETSNWMEGAKKFGELIGRATNGAITVEYHPADELTNGDQTDGIQALIDGTTDISMHSNLIYASFDPRFNVVSLPFLFASTDEADAKLDGAGGQALKEILGEYGLHCMGIGENGFRHPTNARREIVGVADMQGLKLRVSGSKLLNREYELWGADVENADWPVVFTALQTGAFDGQENPLSAANAAAIQDVQAYVTYWTGVYDCLFFCMNQDLYDSLSSELQALVDECGQQAVVYQRQLNREEDETILAQWKKVGITVTELTDEAIQGFKDAAAPCYEEFSAELTPELVATFTGK